MAAASCPATAKGTSAATGNAGSSTAACAQPHAWRFLRNPANLLPYRQGPLAAYPQSTASPSAGADKRNRARDAHPNRLPWAPLPIASTLLTDPLWCSATFPLLRRITDPEAAPNE